MCGVGEKKEVIPAFSIKVNVFQITHSVEELNAFHVLLRFRIKIYADMYSSISKDFLEYTKLVIQNSYSLVLFLLMV